MAQDPESDRPEAVMRKQRNALAEIRETAMTHISRLGKLSATDSDEEKRHLLGRTAGVIDGLNKIGQLVARVVDKERQLMASVDFDEAELEDEAELDRRIADEIALIAARRRAAAVGESRGAECRGEA